MCLWLPPVEVVVGYRITRTVATTVDPATMERVDQVVAEVVEERVAIVGQAPYPTAAPATVGGYAPLSS